MGGKESKEETKTVDTTGNVNNNVVIQEPVPVAMEEVIILLAIITAIKIIELVIYFYKVHTRNVKKKYSANTSPA